MPRSAEATRRRILDAAYAQFYRRGFARVGVDEIAAAAKVTKRSLYYHFESKDELLAAVLDAQTELAATTFPAWASRLKGNVPQIIERCLPILRHGLTGRAGAAAASPAWR